MVVNVTSCNKRISDPFNEKLRARIFTSPTTTSTTGSRSSSTNRGSEHDVETDLASTSSSSSFSSTSTPTMTTSTSFCLSHLVQNFLENNPPSHITSSSSNLQTHHDSSESDPDDSYLYSDPDAFIHDVINPIVYNNVDSFRNQLLSHTIKAIQIFSIFRAKDKSLFRQNLTAYLRELGYNAAVCKTKWTASAGGTLTAGSYDFIDVLHPNPPARYIIDADFSGEFEIARETESFTRLRCALPRVFVGKVDDLKKIVRLMCDEARRSMKINGLSLPPWRRNRYMQLKWLGSYRRSTNYAVVCTAEKSNFAVKCRSVGFDVGRGGGRFCLLR